MLDICHLKINRILLACIVDYYKEIFKRKSFHFFNGGEKTTEEDIAIISDYIKTIVPLYPDIKAEIVIVKENETTCHRGADYCILFYSEPKGDYLKCFSFSNNNIVIIEKSIICHNDKVREVFLHEKYKINCFVFIYGFDFDWMY